MFTCWWWWWFFFFEGIPSTPVNTQSGDREEKTRRETLLNCDMRATNSWCVFLICIIGWSTIKRNKIRRESGTPGIKTDQKWIAKLLRTIDFLSLLNPYFKCGLWILASMRMWMCLFHVLLTFRSSIHFRFQQIIQFDATLWLSFLNVHYNRIANTRLSSRMSTNAPRKSTLNGNLNYFLLLRLVLFFFHFRPGVRN